MTEIIWRAGTQTAVMGQAGTPEDDQKKINSFLQELEQMAYPTGFIADVKSVTYSGQNIVILYQLKNDPHWHPPM